jgi:hypothetical protein
VEDGSRVEKSTETIPDNTMPKFIIKTFFCRMGWNIPGLLHT